MKIWLRLFLFLMAFQVEVRVKAGLLQSPENCVASQGVCAVKAVKGPFHLQTEKLILHATAGSVLEKEAPTLWNFVKGDLWVEKANGVRFQTVFGAIQAEHGQYWILSEGDRIWVRNMSADLQVTLRDGRTLSPPAGFQFWIAGVNTKNESGYGMIQPIRLKEHIPLWWSLFQGDKKAFAERVAHYRDNWGDLVESSSRIYKTQALRRIASEDSRKQAVETKKRQAELERQRIRELYRSRVFDR
jgi:hypothetical protein